VTPMVLYLICLAFGGLLLAASAFGSHDSDHGDHGHGHLDHGHGEHGPHDGHHPAPFLVLLSIRFWTFSLAFFGLTGAALTAVGGMPSLITAAVAAGAGLGAGFVASRLLDSLTRKPLGVVAGAGAHIGREGILLLPVDRAQPGKVRLSIAGASTDFVAETQAAEALPTGTTVLVVGFRGNVALVERTPTVSSKEPL
jgi:membrane protein implicated in regulation of membrane protease activity